MTGYESSLCGKQVWIQNTGAFDEGLADVGAGNTVIATVGDTCPDGTAESGGCQLDDIGRPFFPDMIINAITFASSANPNDRSFTCCFEPVNEWCLRAAWQS